MTDPQIRFGTDGWRGVIARDFTFRNVERVAQATADYFRTVPHGHEALLVGFDVRFLSPRFARATAEVLSANGFRVELLKGVCPTPYVSWAVRKMGFRGGVVITASHNPSEFNGFKVKAHYGGSATPDITAGIEACLDRNEIRSGGPLEEVALSPDYFDHLRSMVDWNRIAESRLRIAVDSMHGSGGTLLEDLLRNTRCAVRTIRGRGDPLFGGVSPEPIMPALAPLSRAVIETGAAIGLATDGDADRLGVVDEDGRFVSTLEVLPLLLLHAYRNRGWRGAVAYTVSQSQIVPRIGASLGLDLHETPIGFKHIAQLMLEREILIGGEESGGIGLSRHLPERDGLFLHLLLLDLLATTGQPLTRLIRGMWEEFGEFHYGRRDLYVELDASLQVIRSLEEDAPQTIADKRVNSTSTLDGVKLRLEGDAWILFRRSGTEPLLRVYCEAPSAETVETILRAGVGMVEQMASGGVSSRRS